jgi:hypothetical protein
VKIGPSLAKLRSTRCCAHASSPRRRRGTTPCTRTKRAALIGVVLAALLRVPHLYDMHSSLPQQLTNFAFSRPVIARRVSASSADDPRSRVVIVICPSLEETVRGIDPGARTCADRERRRIAEERRHRRRRPPCAAVRLTADDADRLYTGTFEAYQGLDLLFDAMAIVAARSRRAAVAGRRQAGPGGAASAQARAAGIAESTIFAGERPAAEIPRYLLACDALVSPASRGHEHAAQDLSVPALGPADRRHPAADAHAGLDDDTAILTGASPAIREGILRRSTIGVGANRSAAGARTGGTKYSYEAYLDRTRRRASAR